MKRDLSFVGYLFSLHRMGVTHLLWFEAEITKFVVNFPTILYSGKIRVHELTPPLGFPSAGVRLIKGRQQKACMPHPPSPSPWPGPSVGWAQVPFLLKCVEEHIGDIESAGTLGWAGRGGGLNSCQEGSSWAGLVSQPLRCFCFWPPAKVGKIQAGWPRREASWGGLAQGGRRGHWAFLPGVEGVGGEGDKGAERLGVREASAA